MKKYISSLMMVLVFLIVFAGCKQDGAQLNNVSFNTGNQLSQKEKLEDFEYMYKILQDNYPFFEVNKRVNGIDWLEEKEKYDNWIKSTKNDFGFYISLTKILAELHNGHAGMLDEQQYFSIKSCFETNPDSSKLWLQQLNSKQALIRYSRQGNVKNSDPAESAPDSNSDSNIVPDNVKTEIINDKTAYLYIKSLNYFNIEMDMKIIKPFLTSIKNVDKLIIDIRGNGGGSDSYWADNIVPMLINKPVNHDTYMVYRGGDFEEGFIKSKWGFGYDKLKPVSGIDAERLKNIPSELKRDFKYYYKFERTIHPKDSIGFKGKIYLIVDKAVYSSSESLAAFAKSTGFAVIVGEKTGGDGIGTDPLVCALPNSGYVFRFPLVMGLSSDGTCNEEFKTEPDIEVPAQRDDNYINDKAIQHILNNK